MLLQSDYQVYWELSQFQTEEKINWFINHQKTWGGRAEGIRMGLTGLLGRVKLESVWVVLKSNKSDEG